MLALRTLEFDRIVEAVTALALTPMGAEALAALEPSTDPRAVAAAQAATSETARYLERHPLFPLRGGEALPAALAGLDTPGRPIEPLQLRVLADFADSVDRTRAAILRAGAGFPVLATLTEPLTPFTAEVTAVRRAIGGDGAVQDEASPELKRLRGELRQKRQKLRGTLEQFARGRDTAKYLQDDVITERNGRFVVMVRAEHRAHVPGIVHGGSATGATLFLEPAATVEINNDIVEIEEREREEVFRILLELTDRFRSRGGDVRTMREVARGVDLVQAKARYGARVNGVEPVFTAETSMEIVGARHPLLERAVPVDVRLDPPMRVLLITGPNTGGKTVALKTAGLFALMAQAGLHVPAVSARLPVFRAVGADIGDEQSIAASLSTFSAHITNLVSMDRALTLPALVLLDEVGTGTDPNEGGALATSIVEHFRQRGALVMATTHFDAVKTWGVGTEGVVVAAFAFDAQTYAPSYRLVYGAPGRSLAIEMAQRLGLPASVVAAARGYLGDDQKRLQAHLARIDQQARSLESARSKLDRDTRALNEQHAAAAARERSLAGREEAFTKRLNERLDERLRQARRDIDEVIDRLRAKSDALAERASIRAALNTGESGALRSEAREAVDRIMGALRQPDPQAGTGPEESGGARPAPASAEPAIGATVRVGGLGLEGIVRSIDGGHADIEVRGKRIRARVRDLRVVKDPPPASPSAERSRVRVNVDLRPREGPLSEITVIGCTVDEAVDRVSRFIDDTMVTDVQEIRVVHGHGTGQLRKGLHAFLAAHPLVAAYSLAPENQGGGGATLVTLKD